MKQKALVLKTKKAVYSDLLGSNSSAFTGDGFDFAEVREYTQGDDIRHINWPISAKLQKIHVNVFRAERELNIIAVLLLDKNLLFGTHTTKLECLHEIFLTIAHAAFQNKDPFSFACFNKHLKFLSKPSKKPSTIQRNYQTLLDMELPETKVDVQGLEKALLSIKKRSIIFLLGDFFYPLKLTSSAKKHVLYAINIRDRFEEEPSLLYSTQFYGLMGKNTLFGDLGVEERKKYKALLLKEERELHERIRQSGIRYTKIYTHEEPYAKLATLFKGTR